MFEFKDCILVTGAAGFIGSHFCKQALAHYDDCLIVALDKSRDQIAMNLSCRFDDQREFSYGDLIQTREEVGEMVDRPHVLGVRGKIGDRALMTEILMKTRPRIVFNFAAESHVDKSIDDATPFLDSNIVQLGALLDVFRSYQGHQKMRPKFVQISTDEVYGDYGCDDGKTEEEMEAGYNERSRLRPSSPYAASKAAGDLLVRSYARTFGITWIITRSANNYGPRQAPEKLIPLMITKAMAGDDLPVYGDGKQSRDWIHVSDNVAGIIAAADNGRDEIFNIGSGVRHWNLEIVKALQALFGDKSKIDFVTDRPGHDSMYRICSDKLRWDMDWAPQIKWLDGMDSTVAWYRDNQQWVENMRKLGYSTERVGLGE